MMSNIIVDVAQVITSFAMVASVIYLGIQIRQNRIIMKLHFGYKLNERLYRRYFESSHKKILQNYLVEIGEKSSLRTMIIGE